MTDGRGVYLTLLEKAPLKTVEVQTKYLDYFTRNIQSFGSSSICVDYDINKTPPFGTPYQYIVEFF